MGYDDKRIINTGIIVYGGGGIGINNITIPNNPGYPTGIKAFYLMNYEVSKGQWADFLNPVTNAQLVTLYYLANQNGYTIVMLWPNFTAAAPDRHVITSHGWMAVPILTGQGTTDIFARQRNKPANVKNYSGMHCPGENINPPGTWED